MTRCVLDSLQVGDWLAAVNYYRVESLSPAKIHVQDASGASLTISREIIARECWSADRFEREEKSSRTAIAHKILAAGDKAFTVSFRKKDGSLRKLRGHLRTLNEEHTVLGMVSVIDLDVKDGSPHRMVTFSTVASLILDGVKYFVK